MEPPKVYTVVGLYADNQEAWCGWLEAATPDQAVQRAREAMGENRTGETNEADFTDRILCVFEGAHTDLWADREVMREAEQP
jgi:hypothetical protein